MNTLLCFVKGDRDFCITGTQKPIQSSAKETMPVHFNLSTAKHEQIRDNAANNGEWVELSLSHLNDPFSSFSETNQRNFFVGTKNRSNILFILP